MNPCEVERNNEQSPQAEASGEESPLGFAFGASASGVGLFAHARRAVGEDRFIESSMEAFDFDFAHRRDGPHGWTWPA